MKLLLPVVDELWYNNTMKATKHHSLLGLTTEPIGPDTWKITIHVLFLSLPPFGLKRS